jgi:hypothetical protein
MRMGSTGKEGTEGENRMSYGKVKKTKPDGVEVGRIHLFQVQCIAWAFIGFGEPLSAVQVY